MKTLQGFITKWGAPKRVIGNSAPSHYAHQVIDYLRMLWIPIWTSKPYYQHQNPFERRYQTFKRIVNQTMDRTNSPPQMWFLCMCYVAFILNRVSDSSLSFKQPHLVATRQVADISAITSFQWMEPVYYKLDSSEFSFPQSNEAMGYFVGFSDTVGHELTFQIYLPSTGKIVDRSAVRSAIMSDNWNLRAASKVDGENTSDP